MIQIRCETCGHKYKVPPRLAKRTPCPRCAGVAPVARPAAPTAAISAGAPPRAAAGGRASVPEYPKLRLLGTFYSALGYIWLGLSILVAIGVALTQSTAGAPILAVLVTAGITLVSLAVTGVILIGLGELVRAFRDLTRNSWRQSYLLCDAMNALAASRSAEPVEQEG